MKKWFAGRRASVEGVATIYRKGTLPLRTLQALPMRPFCAASKTAISLKIRLDLGVA